MSQVMAAVILTTAFYSRFQRGVFDKAGNPMYLEKATTKQWGMARMATGTHSRTNKGRRKKLTPRMKQPGRYR